MSQMGVPAGAHQTLLPLAKTTTVRSTCRICFGSCGVLVDVTDDGTIQQVRPDGEHPLSEGYICVKGRQGAEFANGPTRLLRPLKRLADGTRVEIPFEQALDEIAERMRGLIAEHGADSIAAYRGTAMAMSSVSCPFLPDWLGSFGSSSFFTTLTIDQVAKFVVPDILGRWGAGRTHMLDADVLMLVGTNPLVSATGIGLVNFHPVNRLRELKARGGKMIVIDPRRTETVAYADVFLQPYPGEDAGVAAGLVRAVLVNGWEDRAFCDTHVEPGHLTSLRAAVDAFTPEVVERRCGVDREELLEAARIWSGGRRALVGTGTGMSMGYASNLSEHLYQALEVICGALPRAGDAIRNPGVTAARLPALAQAVSPTRHWEALPPSRIRGAGSVAGERTCGTLADEVLTPGPEQVRGLFCFGGNPAAAVPDRHKITRALGALDLFVIVDPFLNDSAELADYVLPPKIFYERADMVFPRWLETLLIPAPYQQYLPPVSSPPEGADVLEDWEVMWELSRRLDAQVVLDGVPLDMSVRPSSDQMLALLGRNGEVPFDEVRRAVGGAFFDVTQTVDPLDPATAGHFHVCPPDVEADLVELASEPMRPQHLWRDGRAFGFVLASRRMREVYNSFGPQLSVLHRQRPYNPAYLHPDDLAALDASTGDRVRITSAHGEIDAFVEPDSTVKRGVVSMSHGWGRNPGQPSDLARDGSSTSVLIADDHAFDTIHVQPRMSGIPVDVHVVTDPAKTTDREEPA